MMKLKYHMYKNGWMVHPQENLYQLS